MHHGLIWVWAESGPEAFIESAATPIVTCPDLEDQDPLDPGGTRLLAIFLMQAPGLAQPMPRAAPFRTATTVLLMLCFEAETDTSG